MTHSMAHTLKKGDKVQWKTSQGPTTGRVVKKLTSTKQIKGHKAKASPDHSEYLVRSKKSGKTAAHKPESLRRNEDATSWIVNFTDALSVIVLVFFIASSCASMEQKTQLSGRAVGRSRSLCGNLVRDCAVADVVSATLCGFEGSLHESF